MKSFILAIVFLFLYPIVSSAEDLDINKVRIGLVLSAKNLDMTTIKRIKRVMSENLQGYYDTDFVFSHLKNKKNNIADLIDEKGSSFLIEHMNKKNISYVVMLSKVEGVEGFSGDLIKFAVWNKQGTMDSVSVPYSDGFSKQVDEIIASFSIGLLDEAGLNLFEKKVY